MKEICSINLACEIYIYILSRVRVQAEGQAESKITKNRDLLNKYRQEDGIHPVTLNIDRQTPTQTELN